MVSDEEMTERRKAWLQRLADAESAASSYQRHQQRQWPQEPTAEPTTPLLSFRPGRDVAKLKHKDLTQKEWRRLREILVERQNGQCPICKRFFTEKVRPALDHCHETGNIRELLCQFCNMGLGAFGDSVARLENAIEYIFKHIKAATA